jgi:3-dehydroquinate dehydratase / shikimate dehydrogenase
MAKPRQRQALFGRAQDRICAVVAASAATQVIAQIRLALPETRTIELRLDWLRSDSERARLLDWLKRHCPSNATFLATCRRLAGGGNFRGDIQAELFWLIKAREAGCLWCDVEVETLRELPDQSVREYAVPLCVLLSEHDFQRTPPLPRSVNPPALGEADAVKIAAFARTIADSIRLLRLARHSRNFVAVPMGEAGLPARILALREGSALAYAPVATATAPGQISLGEMKNLYRAHKLTRRTAVYAVIGNPIGHSQSPLLHNTGFVARNIDAVLLPFLVRNLRDFLKAIPELGIRGFSVTIPYKQAILKHLAECEPFAAQMGAVNTVVVRRDGSLFGCNTDYLGVLRALERRLHFPRSRILIFGAGGSARSAAFALARAGAGVFICARRESAARALARAVGGEAMPRRALRTEYFDAILNASPVGMHPHNAVSPLAPGELHCRIVMDFIYRPLHTKLLRLAAKKRIATVSGVEMFLAQGLAQWQLWTGRRPPEAPMRGAVLAALRAESRSRNEDSKGKFL